MFVRIRVSKFKWKHFFSVHMLYILKGELPHVKVSGSSLSNVQIFWEHWCEATKWKKKCLSTNDFISSVLILNSFPFHFPGCNICVRRLSNTGWSFMIIFVQPCSPATSVLMSSRSPRRLWLPPSLFKSITFSSPVLPGLWVVAPQQQPFLFWGFYFFCPFQGR